MSSDTPYKQIDGHRYETELFTTTNGIEMWSRLQSLVGPGLMALFEGGANEFKGSSLGDAMKHLVASMGDGKMSEFIKDILENTRRDGNLIMGPNSDYEMFYRGKYHVLIQVLMFVIQSNFFLGKDIISLVSENIEKVSKLVKNSSPTSESTT